MNKNENTYWVVVKLPNGDIRYLEAVDHVEIRDTQEAGAAVREAVAKMEERHV